MKFENKLNKNIKAGFVLAENHGGTFAAAAMVDGEHWAIKFEITPQGWGHSVLKKFNMETMQMDLVWEQMAFCFSSLDHAHIEKKVKDIAGKLIESK